jgi:hypothetical protein
MLIVLISAAAVIWVGIVLDYLLLQKKHPKAFRSLAITLGLLMTICLWFTYFVQERQDSQQEAFNNSIGRKNDSLMNEQVLLGGRIANLELKNDSLRATADSLLVEATDLRKQLVPFLNVATMFYPSLSDSLSLMMLSNVLGQIGKDIRRLEPRLILAYEPQFSVDEHNHTYTTTFLFRSHPPSDLKDVNIFLEFYESVIDVKCTLVANIAIGGDTLDISPDKRLAHYFRRFLSGENDIVVQVESKNPLKLKSIKVSPS